jgi:hypothetical protein
VQHDASVMSLEDIFQEYCNSNNTTIEAPTMETYSMRQKHLTKCRAAGKPVDDIRKEIFERIRKQVGVRTAVFVVTTPLFGICC